MSKVRASFGLVNTVSPEPEIVDCTDDKCGRPIKFMEQCFIDGVTGEIFCLSCGQCKRYERKMAARRESLGIPEIRINGE